MSQATTREIRRRPGAGLILRPFGYGYWGADHSADEIAAHGRRQKRIRFSELAGPIAAKTAMGFSGIALSLKDGQEIRIIGLKPRDAEDFITSANTAWRTQVASLIEGAIPELTILSDALDRLKAPRRYPAACLVGPFVERTTRVLQTLPNELPEAALSQEHKQLMDAVRYFEANPETLRTQAIEAFIASELVEMKDFFDGIETHPLTPEQRLAVVTDEDATLVLAGAGSGKTSVIVAKAAYLIERGIRQPNEILLMAFGKDAAAEMATRIKDKSGASVDAMTFHALGYEIIRQVEGGTPALAAHASDDAQFRALLRDILADDVGRAAGLAGQLISWFSEFFWPYKSEWDFKSKSDYFQYVESHELRTLQGEVVKSFEEWEIANWLYCNGIAYEYEPSYEHKIKGTGKKDYTPDFRLTESGVYIEHFGVRKAKGADGSYSFTTAPHVDHKSYLDGMEWKRKVHQEHGTTLIETYSYEKAEGRLTEALKHKLEPHVTLNPIPPERLLDTLMEMGQVDAFTQTVATFLRHFKSAGTTIDACKTKSEEAHDKRRCKAFLKIFEPLYEAYQKRLGEKIDFEDMIIRAAEHVEAGRYKSPYKHLLVDEFQDISAGRARLLKALKAQHDDARIFAVGDDWQSIYRFTGSDIHLMRHFGEEFGGTFGTQHNIHQSVDLGRTFRSVDKIALPARRFVLQNPSQIEKKVAPAGTVDAPAITVAHYDRGQDDAALAKTLDRISSATIKPASVLLLGRYHFLRPKNLKTLESGYPKLSLRFMTVHASKGLEADHVIILRATTEQMGFPSEIVDDPILDLVLPEPEQYDHAEERRLFYVALTRARKSVTILANREKPSCFVRELLDNPAYETIETGDTANGTDLKCHNCGGRMITKISKSGHKTYRCAHGKLCGETLKPCSACGQDIPRTDPLRPMVKICSCGAEFKACPSCDQGWLVERAGRYGPFLSCIRYPNCEGRAKKKKTSSACPKL